MMETKSIEQLEKDIWEEPSEFPTDLVEKCFQYRKINIGELTNEQLRLLISQNIGLDYLIGIALEKLEQDICAEGDFYKGDLLYSVSRVSTEFWSKKPIEYQTLKQLVKVNSKKIKSELGDKHFDKIKERIQDTVEPNNLS